MSVEVLVEVSGCPTTCMHCWALGPYSSAPWRTGTTVSAADVQPGPERDLLAELYRAAVAQDPSLDPGGGYGAGPGRGPGDAGAAAAVQHFARAAQQAFVAT